MRVLERTAAVIVIDRDGVAQAQTTAGAVAAVLNGAGVASGVAVFAPPRRVTVFSGSNIAASVFTINGTDRAGTVISDTVTGVNNTTVATNKLFASVTSVTTGAAVASNFEVGWSGESITLWIFVGQITRRHVTESLRAIIGAGDTVSYIVEGTSQNMLRDRVSGEHPDDLADLTGALTANYNTTIDGPMVAYRLKVTTQTLPIKLRIVPSASS